MMLISRMTCFNLASLAIIISTLSACNKNSFSGKSPKAPASTPAPATADGKPAIERTEQEATEEFPLSAAQGKVDMIWLVDNSSSMIDEAAQVRQNVSSFIATLQNRTDTQLALISSIDDSEFGTTSVVLTGPDLAKGHKQVNIEVGSTNALAIAASALCAPETTDSVISMFASSVKICGHTLGSDTLNGFYGIESTGISQARGQLSNFFRADAKHIIVIVTDDDAVGVNSTNFMSMVAASANSVQPTIFSFSGSDQSSCSISAVGSSYNTLAAATGGQVFDICAQDWSPNFSKLSEQVAQIANNSFTIAKPRVKKVLAVSVDGIALTATQYTVSGNAVQIDRASLPATSSKVTIKYTY